MNSHPAEQSPLGKSTAYVSHYSPQLLFPIARDAKWQELGLRGDSLPFVGEDIWNCCELSWLESGGKPRVMAAEFRFAASSPAIIESKSFKLYLNSFNQSRFDSVEAVQQVLQQDLSAACGAPVQVLLQDLHGLREAGLAELQGKSLDDLDVQVDQYHYNPALLALVEPAVRVEQTWVTDLFKSNCPVTGQPDWASLQISYAGPQLDEKALLGYLLSFREHADFHEQCVERIFCDLRGILGDDCRLLVSARYLRRGGLDINPWRSCGMPAPGNLRLARQ